MAIIVALFGPGLGQMYVGRRTHALVAFAVFVACILATTFTVYAFIPMVLVYAASFVDTVIHVARKQPSAQAGMPAAILWGAGAVVGAATQLFLGQAFKLPSSSMHPTLMIEDRVWATRLMKSPDRGDLIVFQQPCMPDRLYLKRVIALGRDTVEVRCNVVYINGKPIESKLVKAEDSYIDVIDWDDRRDRREQQVSRYRETIGEHTFDTFHDPDRPARDAMSVADSKDFPQETEMSCNTQRDYESRPSEAQAHGEIVETGPDQPPCAPHRHYIVPADHVFVMGDNRGNSNDSRYWGSVPVANITGRVKGIWWPIGRFGGVD
jgi:signal peptidase I